MGQAGTRADRLRCAQAAVLPHAARHLRSLQARDHPLAGAGRPGARPPHRPAVLEHRGRDRGRHRAPHADLRRHDRRSADPRGGHAERLRGAPPQGGAPQHDPVLRHRDRSRAGIRRADQSGRRLHPDRLRRMLQFVLRLRPLSHRQGLGLFRARARRGLRAGDPGGGAPHPLLHQLAPLPAAAALRPGSARVGHAPLRRGGDTRRGTD